MAGKNIYTEDPTVVSNLEQLFNLFDISQQGWIDVSEFAKAQAEVAHQMGFGDDVDISELFSSIDKDSNGQISKEEFFGWQCELFASGRKTKSRISRELANLVREMSAKRRRAAGKAAPKRGSATAAARRGSGVGPSNSTKSTMGPTNSTRSTRAGSSSPRPTGSRGASPVPNRSASPAPSREPQPRRRGATPEPSPRGRASPEPGPRGRASSPEPAPRGGSSSTRPASPGGRRPSGPAEVVETVDLHAGERMPEDDPREFAWRNQTVIGAFLDPYIENTNLEGGHLAIALKEVSTALKGMLDTDLLPSKAVADAAVRAAADLLDRASADGTAAQEAYKNGDGMTWIQSFRTQLLALPASSPPHNMLVQEGGWRGGRGAHAILYVFERTSATEYALTVVNTGAGIHTYHPSNAEAMMDGKMKYRTALRIPNISAERLLSPEFLFNFFRMKHKRHEHHYSQQLYSVLVPWLLGQVCGGDIAAAAKREESLCGDFATAQRSGTCFFKCVGHTVRFLLQSCGVTAGDRKAIMLGFRVHLLDQIIKDLPEALRLRTLTASERLVVTIAAKQVARRALKENSAGRLESGRLEKVREKVDTVQTLLAGAKPLVEEGDASHSFPPDAKWSPFTGFSPISDSFNVLEPVRAELGGPVVNVEPPVFVDLADIQEAFAGSRGARSGRIAGLLTVLRKLVDAADELDNAGEVQGKRQVLAMIEDLLVDNQFGAGSPILLNDADGAGAAPIMTCQERDELLGLWEVISRHYLSAALSVPNGPLVFGRRIVAYARLLEQLDRVVRSRASGRRNSPFFECMKDIVKPMWQVGTLPLSNTLSDRHARPGVDIGALTAYLPCTSPAVLRCRNFVTSYFGDQASDGSGMTLCACESGRNQFWFKHLDGFPGISTMQFSAKLVGNAKETGLLQMSQSPEILERGLERPARDFEINSAWAFDPGLDRACVDWKQCRDTFVRFHILLGLARPRADGSDSMPLNGFGSVVSCKAAALKYTLSFYDVIAGQPDVLQVNVGLGKDGGQPGLISADVPVSHCTPNAWGITSKSAFRRSTDVCEQDILATDPLPDFGRSLTQRDAEELFSILSVPFVRIPLLLRFLVPDRVFLLHDPQMQGVIFCGLFEPGPLSGSKVTRVTKAPCEPNQLGSPEGFLMNELTSAPSATLVPFIELLQAKTELGACDFDGPYVQPFLFALRLSLLLQGFLLEALRVAAPRSKQFRTLEHFTTVMRRFNQAYARSRLTRWLEQATFHSDFGAAATLHAHLCLTSLPLLSLELQDVQSLVSSSALFRTWHREVPSTEGEARAAFNLSADVVVLVTVCMHKHRVDVLQWLSTQKVRDDIMNFTLMQALGQRGEEPPGLTWRAIARDIEGVIRVKVESGHPFSKADIGDFPIDIPSTDSITIRFDERSVCQSWQSFSLMLKGKCLWSTSNTAKNPLPGVGDELPFVINKAGKDFKFSFGDLAPAGGDEKNRMVHWGYSLVAETPLSAKLLDDFAASQAGVAKWACAEALCATGGSKQKAAVYIVQERERFQEEEARRAARASCLGRFESDYEGSAWPASLQWLQGAIFDVQSGALYFRRRGGPEPLPDDLLGMGDFQSVRDLLRFSDLGQPNCVVQATQVLRQKKLQFSSLGNVFTAELWAGIPSSGDTGHIRRGSGGTWERGAAADPAAANLPFLKNSKLQWRGIEWTELGNWRKALPERLTKSSALRALLSRPKPIEGERDPPPDTWLEAFGWPSEIKDTRCYISSGHKQCAVLSPQENTWAELRISPGGNVTIFALEEVGRSVFCYAVWTSDVRVSLFYCDPSASGRIRSYPSSLSCPAGELYIGSCSKPSIRLTREHEIHVPRRLLMGLLPYVMLRDHMPAFDFWQSGEAITGEPRDKHNPWFFYLLHVDLPRRNGDQAAVWRQGSDGEQWFLINLETASAQHLRHLCSVLSRLEPLAFVLVWAVKIRNPSSQPNTGDDLELRAVELPRLGLRLDPQQAEKGGYRLQSRAHEGFFLSPWSLDGDRFPYIPPPENAILKSLTGNLKIVAPIGPIRREEVYVEPFGQSVVIQRATDAATGWHSKFVTYEVPILKTALVCGSQLSALWICTTRLIQRDYLGAAKMLTFCIPDHRFMREDWLVWQEATRLTADAAPNAGAIRLRLLLLAEHWGGLQENVQDVSKGALFQAWGEYLCKLTHVSPECRLKWREEILLLKVLRGTTFENEITNQLVQNRGCLVAEFLRAEQGGTPTATLSCGWSSGGFWWKEFLERANFGGVRKQKWQVDTVNCEVKADSNAIVSEETLVSHCQDVKLLKGPWAALYAIFQGQLRPPSTFKADIRAVASLALREYLRHNSTDRTGTSLESCLALSLAVLFRDTEPGVSCSVRYPPYANIVATETKDVMHVDTEARALFFLEFCAAAMESLTLKPWEPYGPGDFPSKAELTHMVRIRAADLPFELPRAPTDFSCPWRAFVSEEASHAYPEVVFSEAEVASAAAGEPMQLAIPSLFEIAGDAPWKPLPWQSEAGEAPLPSLQTVLGINQVTMDRMKKDCEVFHDLMQAATTRPQLSFLSRADLGEAPSKERAQEAMRALDSLLDSLAQASVTCMQLAEASAATVAASFNRPKNVRDALAQIAGNIAGVSWSWVLCLTLGHEAEVLKALGQDSRAEASAMQAVMCVIARASLVQQVRRARALGFRLRKALQVLLGDSVSVEELREAESAMESLAAELLARRTSGEKDAAGVWGADPKLLVFEWVFGKGLLKKEQLGMVRAFADAANRNNSKVTQMIMGGGKTHVISPLLQLHLCSKDRLVVQVVPESLLSQTIRVMRCELSQFLSMPVFCFSFSRSAERDVELIKRMRWRLSEGIVESAVICSTGSSVKACLLTYVDILALSCGADMKLHEEEVCKAQNMQRILQYLRAATAVLDEIDLLLHPLKSEMNFPLGSLEDIDLTPERWELPQHLLEPFCLTEADAGSGGTSRATKALLAVRKAIRQGYKTMAMQQQPHVLLLSREFYNGTLLPPLKDWLAEWLLSQQCLQSQDRGHIVSLLDVEAKSLSGIPPGKAKQLLVLSREWLLSMLPHCLQKLNRVQYGLLLKPDVERLRKRGQPSFGTRLDLAVPFVGKDTPSAVSEFSHPEVLVGLTILACAHTGLRDTDVKAAVLHLKGLMTNENVGVYHRRPSWRLYQRWLAQAELKLADAAPSDSGTAAKLVSLPPLHLTVPEGYMLRSIHKHLSNVLDVQTWYLSQIVFPRALRIQHTKLSATASELGGADLFKVRLGFSGTPASTLPMSLPEVDFAPGTEGKVLATMTALDVVSLRRIGKGWTVRSLLSLVASSGYHALIDTGALVTGMNNVEVAAFLLEKGLPGLDGVVFLSRDDTEMVLLRGARMPIPLAECALAPQRRFTFYDNSHTTGIDIDQAYLATAALTLGKDMTFRDAQQGAWRMRRLGIGQRLQLLLVEELVGVIQGTLGVESVVPKDDDSKALRDVVAFLLANQLSGEVMAASQLAHQDLINAWKSHAIEALVDKAELMPKPEGVDLPPKSRAAVSILTETISFDIASDVESGSESVISKLEAEADAFRENSIFGSSGSSGASSAIARASEMLTEARRGGPSGRRGLLRSKSSSECVDAEVVRESEQEQEKVVEAEKESVASLGRAALNNPTEWELAPMITRRQSSQWKDIEGIIEGSRGLICVKGFRIRNSGGSCIRFSPNALPEKSGANGIWKPVLTVLHVLQERESYACVLTLAEAAAVRQAMCQGFFDDSVRLELRVRSSVEQGSSVDGAVLAAGKTIKTEVEKKAVAQQQALLRFFQGEVWLSEDEVDFLQEFSGGQSAMWSQAWGACEAWRRTGGVQRWGITPVGRIIGDRDCIEQLEAEQTFQSAASKLVVEAGGVISATGLYDWLSTRCGDGSETADFDKVADCIDDSGWKNLVRRFRDDHGTVSLRPLAEEVASRVAGSSEGGAGGAVLVNMKTRELLGGDDFIEAAREAEAHVTGGEESKFGAVMTEASLDV